jgi:glycosyltransferase involved in cell wall biosynthesis
VIAGVRWLSLGPGSGYGNASQDYIAGLRAAGVSVAWTPLEWAPNEWGLELGPVAEPDVAGFRHADLVGLQIEYDAAVVHSTPVWAEQLRRATGGRLLVAFTTWETDRLPPDRVEILNHYDRVIVPSQFNAEIFEASGVTKPIRVVPHIARDPRRPDARQRTNGGSTFVFYMIASWTTRKAILDAVEAFVSAFSDEDDVKLFIHTTATDLIAAANDERTDVSAQYRDASWHTLARALAGRAKLPEIVLSTRTLSDPEIEAVHRAGDCFFSLTRGEGWGLGAFDACAFANPVVITGWSATNEFLPAGYPYRVDYDLVATTSDPRDAWWAPRAGERWARARVANAATLLRYVFEHREEAARWGRELQANVLGNFDAERVTARLCDALAGVSQPAGRRDPETAGP